MTDNSQRQREAIDFASVVLGIDGVSEGPAPPGSTLALVVELAERYEAEGRSKEELAEAVRALIKEPRA